MAAPVRVKEIIYPFAGESTGGSTVTFTLSGWVPVGHFIRARLVAGVLRNDGDYGVGAGRAVIRSSYIGARNDTGSAASDAYVLSTDIVSKASVFQPVLNVDGATGDLSIIFDPASETDTYCVVGEARIGLSSYANTVEFDA